MGAMNRVQFQAGLSREEFDERDGTEEKCPAEWEASRWPTGFCCPSCRDTRHTRFEREGRAYGLCYRCRKQSTVISGTIFPATKWPLKRWFLAMHLLTQSQNNVSARERMRHLGVGYKTVWWVKHQLLEVMTKREEDRGLAGRVEIDDDAYRGAEKEGKPGRGSENKIFFVAAVQTRDDGHPLLLCLKRLPFTQESHRRLGEPLPIRFVLRPFRGPEMFHGTGGQCGPTRGTCRGFGSSGRPAPRVPLGEYRARSS